LRTTSAQVAAASKYMCNVLYGYKGKGLSVGSMVAGYDKTGAKLYLVDNDGSRVPGNMFSVGSGSIYAYGVLDSVLGLHNKTRASPSPCSRGAAPKLTDEEARTLGRQAIAHATYRDAGSGGNCNMVRALALYTLQVHITPTSKVRFDGIDVSEMTREMGMANYRVLEDGIAELEK